MWCGRWKVVGDVSDIERENVVIEVAVVDADGKPGCTGNGDDPCRALLDFPVVAGDAAAVEEDAAAAAGPVVAMASATADCLEADDLGVRDGLSNAKAMAGDDAIGDGA